MGVSDEPDADDEPDVDEPCHATAAFIGFMGRIGFMEKPPAVISLWCY